MNAGLRVAAADVNGDGTPDIITGPGKNFAPVVKVFDGTNPDPDNPIFEFFAFPESFMGGVLVAGGDVNGDGKADIIAGAGYICPVTGDELACPKCCPLNQE